LSGVWIAATIGSGVPGRLFVRADRLTGENSNKALARARREVFRIKTECFDRLGWSPRIRQYFGYFTPDEWYEAAVLLLIDKDTDWLDVGCGRALFPSNSNLERLLSSRCRLLVGVDPDDNIMEHALLHERHKCTIEQFDAQRQFDLITLRMVAEHVVDPLVTVAALGRLTRKGGRVIVYTVDKYSIISLTAAVTPLVLHQWARALLWGSSEQDTFSTLYRMNTRKDLLQLFSACDFVEENFYYLNDCSTFGRWKFTTILELCAERVLRGLRLRYPEVCLLGIYRKS
jgi:2-polyprenyl-3-methyl-5-hydroxy-6-metoxy-1,4-benzoquinol methylase